jgi:hypothetical protein
MMMTTGQEMRKPGSSGQLYPSMLLDVISLRALIPLSGKQDLDCCPDTL